MRFLRKNDIETGIFLKNSLAEYANWIISDKQEETKKGRVERAILLLSEEKKLK